MDIKKSNYGYPKFKIIFGYPKIHLRISLIKLIIGFLDPKIELWISIIHHDFWISKNVF